MSDVEYAVKQFVLKEFLPGEDPGELTSTTPLITGGILDSLATMKLIMFLEERYGVKFEAHEVDAEQLDTVADIAKLVAAKKG